jgi:hypothetical protein
MLRRRPQVLRRLLRIAILTVLILFGCLIATISVGAGKLCPTFCGWAEAPLNDKEIPLVLLVRHSALRWYPEAVTVEPSLSGQFEISALVGSFA